MHKPNTGYRFIYQHNTHSFVGKTVIKGKQDAVQLKGKSHKNVSSRILELRAQSTIIEYLEKL